MPVTLAESGAKILTSCQTAALDILQREGNVFLTGAAGTGKSFLLGQYLADKPADAFPVVASTGAAAVLVGGRTFHSFFALGIMEGGIDATVARALRSRKLVYRLLTACCLIIDEVSMLSGTTLAAAERIARLARNRDEPWGGLRLIVVGDFAQLPPVTPNGHTKDWAFLHDVWKDSAFQPALLSTVMRTQDSDFLHILNLIRSGTVNEDVTRFLDSRTIDFGEEPEGTRLYPHRSSADNYNLRKLLATPGRERSFHTVYEGEERLIESAKKAMPIPDVLMLKEDALVMLRKNDTSLDQLYVNGSLGRVRDIGDDTLTITLLSGPTIEVEKQKFSYLNGDGLEVAAAWNFPVTLAWATTIHKAQGTSVDSLIADLGALWEPGQAYVALSRVRSAGGVHIERWTPQAIRSEPLVTALYDSLAAEMQTYTPRPLFVQRLVPKEAAELDDETEERPKRKNTAKLKRAALIRTMLKDEATLYHIADAVGIKEERVLKYIEEFIAAGVSVSLQYLLETVEHVGLMRSTLEENNLQLSPSYHTLEGTVSFETLRLVRCAILAERGS